MDAPGGLGQQSSINEDAGRTVELDEELAEDADSGEKLSRQAYLDEKPPHY